MLGESVSVREALTALEGTRLLDPLRSRYAEPWRAYHDETHILELKGHLLQAEGEGIRIEDGAAALAFVLWHDAVYDPQAAPGRNEELSAQLCAAEFASIGHPESVDRACAAIRATVRHEPPDSIAYPDVPLLLDCDLAILGAEPSRFDAYDVAIRKEYAHVPEAVYCEKRAEVLARFLARERLYLTEWGRNRWEKRAWVNLDSAIRRLG